MESAVDLLSRQLDEAYRMIRDRVEGLSEDEFWWEPVPGCWTVRLQDNGRWAADYEEPDPDPAPFTTIAWRLVHVAECKLMYHEYAFGPGKLVWPELDSPHTPDEGIRALEDGQRLLAADLETLKDGSSRRMSFDTCLPMQIDLPCGKVNVFSFVPSFNSTMSLTAKRPPGRSTRNIS